MKSKVLNHFIVWVAIAALGFLLAENSALGLSHPLFFRHANLACLAILGLDTLVRLLTATGRRDHLRKHWFELIVFLPLLQYVPGVVPSVVFVVLRQAAALAILVSRGGGGGRISFLFSLQPTQLMAVTFLITILGGTILLMQPAATVSGNGTGLVDALFTATSATCVTGLTVLDTATHFSTFGQLVILALIQIGGLGIMTFSVTLAVLLRKPVDINRRAAMQGMLDYDTLAGVRTLTLFIVAMTLVIELIGGLALTAAWLPRFHSLPVTMYHAFFHSVSAFCNAGFSTFSDNLCSFRGHVATNLILCLIIVFGGLGFLVVRDFMTALTRRTLTPHSARPRLRVQTHIALKVTALLIVGGALTLYLTEKDDSFSKFPVHERVLASLFQSVAARTAGFNSCDIGRLTDASLITLMLLMFIGACPGSTGGGIKTTTAAVLWASVISAFRQREHVEIHRRTIPPELIHKATALLCVSLAWVIGFAIALSRVQHAPMADVMFETVSAFGTVGLSTGLTPSLTPAGRMLITVLMFVGRLGPLTLAYAFALRGTPAHYEYAEERVMIG